MEPKTWARLPGPIASSFGLALGRDSNSNNGEHIWRVGWHEMLEIGRDRALRVDGSARLRIASEYSVIQRNMTKREIHVLESRAPTTYKPEYRSSPEPEEDSNVDHSSVFRPSKSSAGPTKSNDYTLRSKARASWSPDNTFVLGTSSHQPSNITQLPKAPLPQDQDSVKSSVPPPAREDPIGSPRSVCTLPVRRGQDLYRLIDFALLRTYDIEGASDTVVHGHSVRPQGAHPAVLTEIKSGPSRSGSGREGEGDAFDRLLGLKLGEAYLDFCHKLPIVFASHKQQKSVITLACSGLWWAFSIVKRGDTRILWSKPFCCGRTSHDGLLSVLIEAGAKCSHDPWSSPGIEEVLEEHIPELSQDFHPPAAPHTVDE